MYFMKRKLVQAGGSLAVTLPAELIHEFKLKKGMSVARTGKSAAVRIETQKLQPSLPFAPQREAASQGLKAALTLFSWAPEVHLPG